MNIKKIELKNIANFSDTTINLKCYEDENLADIHIFVGENGAGKTFIFQYISNHKSTFFRSLFARGLYRANFNLELFITKTDWQIEKINQFMNIVFKLDNFNVFNRNNFDLANHQERLLYWIFDVLYSDIRILLLDDIEMYLDIETQRRILPAIQQVLKGYQVFVSTHSPFVAGSIGNASIYKINPNKREINAIPARLGRSYSSILEDFFDINSQFDCYTESLFKEFKDIRHEFLKNQNENNTSQLKLIFQKFLPIIENSEYVEKILAFEVRQIQHITGIDVSDLFIE